MFSKFLRILFVPKIMYCYIEFKLDILKTYLILFLIRVKELFEPIVLKTKGDGCLLFLKAFLKIFCSKKRKIGKENLYSTKNQLGRNETCCAEDNHNWVTCVKRTSQIRIWRNIEFSRNCSKFHIFTTIVIFQLVFQSQIVIYYTNCFYPIHFHGSSMRGILFFNFASCKPLTLTWVSFLTLHQFAKLSSLQ